jgi:hypothetical protein
MDAFEKINLFLEGNTYEVIKALEKRAKKFRRKDYDDKLLEKLK